MREELRAEMGASVWTIEVQVGDRVDPGGTVMVLESMKMEIPVISETGGQVREICVNQGDTVSTSDLLVILE